MKPEYITALFFSSSWLMCSLEGDLEVGLDFA